MDARKNPSNARGSQPKHALAQPCEHRMIVGQDGIVPVLKKICQVDFDLFAENTAAINAPRPLPNRPCHGRDPRSPEDRPNPEITTTTEPALRIGPLEQIFFQRLIRK
jgi:hypothetical protein